MAYSVVMQNQAIAGASTLVIIRAAATAATRASYLRILRAWCRRRRPRRASNSGSPLVRRSRRSARTPRRARQPRHRQRCGRASRAARRELPPPRAPTPARRAAGTFTPIIEDGFNNLNGWLWIPTPEERILLAPDTAIALKLIAAPTTLDRWTAGLTFEELN